MLALFICNIEKYGIRFRCFFDLVRSVLLASQPLFFLFFFFRFCIYTHTCILKVFETLDICVGLSIVFWHEKCPRTLYSVFERENKNNTIFSTKKITAMFFKSVPLQTTSVQNPGCYLPAGLDIDFQTHLRLVDKSFRTRNSFHLPCMFTVWIKPANSNQLWKSL